MIAEPIATNFRVTLLQLPHNYARGMPDPDRDRALARFTALAEREMEKKRR
jgi:hypothetical protein